MYTYGSFLLEIKLFQELFNFDIIDFIYLIILSINADKPNLGFRNIIVEELKIINTKL